MALRLAIIGSRGYPSTYGGFETLVRELAPYLVEQGDDVTVYCREPQPGTIMRNGIRCISTKGYESNSLSTLTYGATAIRHASKEKYDAALVLNVANGFFLPMLRRARVPVAVNVDGIEWEREKWNKFGKAAFRRGARMTAKYATTLVVDSLEIGRIWRTQFGRESTYIPYGATVPTEAVAHDRLKPLGLQPGSYVLAVARVVPENNVDLFLDALDAMSPRPPAVVVGNGQPSNPTVVRLERMAAEEPNFQWLGHVDDQQLLTQLWAHCGAYFHGHSAGGTNPALLQALGLGAPAVAVRTPFNAEVLQNEAQLVGADAPAVAGTLRTLLDDCHARESFAEAGRGNVKTRYKWNAVLSSYRLMLESLVEVSRTGGR